MLRVVSLNTWQERGPWRERWELIFAGLETYRPDIVGFQEVFNMEWADEVQKRSGYPHLVKSGQNSGLIFLSRHPVLASQCLTYAVNRRLKITGAMRFTLYFRQAAEKLPDLIPIYPGKWQMMKSAYAKPMSFCHL